MATHRTRVWREQRDEAGGGPAGGRVARWVRQQERAADLWRASLEGASLDALMALGVREMADELGVGHVELWARGATRDGGGGTVDLEAGVGWLRDRCDATTISECMASQAALTLAASEPIMVADLATEKRFGVSPRLLAQGAVSSMSVLIRSHPHSMGVMIAYTHGGSPREFSRSDVSFARGVANVLAAAIRSDASDRALRDGAERMRAVLDTVIEGIVTIDECGTIESVNPAACALFGYTREELVGRNVKVLMPDPYHAEHDEYLANYRKTKVPKVTSAGREVIGRRRDGGTFPLHLGMNAFVVGERRMFAGVLRDLTEQKRLEREILAIASGEQTRIGQDLHDGLCQELAGVTFTLEVLERKLAARDAPEAAGIRKVKTLVEQSVAHARTLAQGLQPVTLDAAGLTSALRELSANLEATFHVSCPFVSESEVLVHDNQIATHVFRIAQEAVGNAIKHGRARMVILELSADETWLRLTVTDDGIGLVTSAREDGRRIGMKTMAYRARVVGGRVEVRAGEHGGTVVTCEVPLRGPAEGHDNGHDKGHPTGPRSWNDANLPRSAHASARGRRRADARKTAGRPSHGKVSGLP